MGEGWQSADDDLVVTLADGSAPNPESFSNLFGKLSRRARLRSIRLHDLRHNYATATLASGVTKKRAGFPRDFEVELDVADGFEHATIVDGRWVFTIEQAVFQRGQYLTTLTTQRMAEISAAIAVGLQLL